MSEAEREQAIQELIDGRLDPERAADLQAALAADPALAARVAAQRADLVALRAALAPKAAEPVPAQLSLAALEAGRNRVLPRLAAAAVIFALGLGAGWGIAQRPLPETPATRLAAGEAQLGSEARIAHAVYTVEVAHPVEVGADQSTHLMAWLSKRLGRRLSAPDLSAQGFALVGGRLLPAEAGPAAQLMYEDATGLRLTLYITAMAGDESAFRFSRGADGVSSLVWLDGGYGCAVSAPMERDRLWPLAEAAYRALSL